MTKEKFNRIEEAADRVLNRMDAKSESLAAAIEAVIPDYADVRPRDVARRLGHAISCDCSVCK